MDLRWDATYLYQKLGMVTMHYDLSAGREQEGPSLLSSPASQSVRAPGSIKDIFHSVSWKIVKKDADVDLWPPRVCVHIQTRTSCT